MIPLYRVNSILNDYQTIHDVVTGVSRFIEAVYNRKRLVS